MECADVRGNIDYAPLPTDLKTREGIKTNILSNVRGPFREFENYYALADVVRLYDELWEEQADVFY